MAAQLGLLGMRAIMSEDDMITTFMGFSLEIKLNGEIVELGPKSKAGKHFPLECYQEFGNHIQDQLDSKAKEFRQRERDQEAIAKAKEQLKAEGWVKP